jgi:hypothetical protein
MAKPKKTVEMPEVVEVPVDFHFKDEHGRAKVRKCRLTFSLSLEALSALQHDQFGSIPLHGAVMPVDDHPHGAVAVDLQQAA